MTPPPIRLGRYELRPDTRELCEHGRPLRIGERAFDILRALVDAGGRPLSRDALFDRAWPGRVVLDDSLKVQVMALRRVLGRDAVITARGVNTRPARAVATSEGANTRRYDGPRQRLAEGRQLARC